MTDEAAGASAGGKDVRFDRPILIVSPPRSGSTLLFETMAKAPDLYTIGTESHVAIESIPPFRPANRGWNSNRLTLEDARSFAANRLANSFYSQLRDRDGNPPLGPVRMLEKTPKNALRIPFFDELWPDSTFIYLHRDVRSTLASMIEAWMSGRFVTYPSLPGWTGQKWSLLLVPGWPELIGKPLPIVVAWQWAVATKIMLDDLSRLPRERIRAIRHADFVDEPNARISALARSVGLEWDRELGTSLPLSAYTVSRPSPDKWRRFESEIEAVMPIVAGADARAKEFLSKFAD